MPNAAPIHPVPRDAVNSNSTDAAVYTRPDDEVRAHQIGNHKVLRQPAPINYWQRIFRVVQLKLIIDPDGHVLSATPQQGPTESYDDAIAEAMTWKYKPFEKDGVPVTASITDYVRVLPPEQLPATHRDFPPITNLAGVVMTLSRSGCFGTCPSYSVEIHGDGTVLYAGDSFVVFTGEHRNYLSPEKVSEILDAFKRADYFSLKDEYSYQVTDCPTYTTTFRMDQVSKSVRDYVGAEAGMPQAVTDLENTFDRVAGTMKWIKGDADTIAALKREQWNFKSPEAAQSLVRASREKNMELVRALVSEGVAVSGTDETGNTVLAAAAGAGDRHSVKLLLQAGADKKDIRKKTQALAAAARSGDPERVTLLLRYGGNAKGWMREPGGRKTVLMETAASGVPEVVSMVLAENPDVNARDEVGHSAFWYVSDGHSSLDRKDHANRAEVVHLLAGAGADLDLRDNEGNTALHTADNAVIARALIQEGANVNICNNRGDTPLMMNFSFEVAKVLVAAGADFHARNNEGKTALDLAQQIEPTGKRAQFLKELNSTNAAKP
jgi:ankyrin repeat protein